MRERCLNAGIEIGVAGVPLHEVLGCPVRGPNTLGQSKEMEAAGVAVDDVKRLLTNRSGRAQHGHVDWSAHQRMWNIVT